MQTTQGSVLDTLRAIQQFLDDNAAKLGNVVQSGTRRQLNQVVAQLAAFAATQSGKKTAGDVAHAKALRVALVDDHMTVIARIAAVDLPQTPQLQNLRMPKGKLTLAKLVAYAHAMANTATPHSDIFVAAGMSPDFLAQLNAAADAVETFDSQRKQLRAGSTAATGGIKTSLSAASRIVSVIDGMVKTALKGDTTLLTFWSSVKKARKAVSRPASPPAPLTIPGTPEASPAVPPTTGGAS